MNSVTTNFCTECSAVCVNMCVHVGICFNSVKKSIYIYSSDFGKGGASRVRLIYCACVDAQSNASPTLQAIYIVGLISRCLV